MTDAFGCPGSGSFIDTSINPAYPSEITLLEGACGGGANGAIEVWINPAWFDGGGNWLSLWQNGWTSPCKLDINSSVATCSAILN
ncbi:MAG: hypothetical protein IPG92_13930 [Flavobacteriales bacterium]|nr:hypothetical protein [Flavobacteriales bacterium]